jgi:hypothetical protein
MMELQSVKSTIKVEIPRPDWRNTDTRDVQKRDEKIGRSDL